MGKTSIEWCDHTVNPLRARDIRTGSVGHHCERVSPGCAHCYASTMQPMRFGLPEFDDPKRHVQPFLETKVLTQVLARKEPTTYFWCDMTDMFGEWHQPKWIDACFATMALTPRHKHLVLTKRTERMYQYFAHHNLGGKRIREAAIALMGGKPLPDIAPTWPLRNVRLGASVENQATADQRLPELLRCPAFGHFLSVEPQIGPITLTWAACTCADKAQAFKSKSHAAECALYRSPTRRSTLLSGVIVGGENAKGARPFNLQWPRSIIRQCGDLNVPVFVKQLGSFPTFTPVGTKEWEKNPTKPIRLKLRSRKGNRMEEWPEDLRVREPMR